MFCLSLFWSEEKTQDRDGETAITVRQDNADGIS
jgi:hypothetical protein